MGDQLEISASNLISFVYHGHKEDVKFIYVPLLNEVSFSGIFAFRLIHNFQLISCFSSQLTKLSLTIDEIFKSPIEFPHFRLEFETLCKSDQSLLVFTNLIDACPVLHRFKLKRKLAPQARPASFPHVLIRRMAVGNANKVTEVSNKIHQHLNTFEIVGFEGCKLNTELVLYLARFAIVLEKVILHPLEKKKFGISYVEASTKEQAKLLRNQQEFSWRFFDEFVMSSGSHQ